MLFSHGTSLSIEASDWPRNLGVSNRSTLGRKIANGSRPGSLRRPIVQTFTGLGNGSPRPTWPTPPSPTGALAVRLLERIEECPDSRDLAVHDFDAVAHMVDTTVGLHVEDRRDMITFHNVL